jgi:hypothetical protein
VAGGLCTEAAVLTTPPRLRIHYGAKFKPSSNPFFPHPVGEGGEFIQGESQLFHLLHLISEIRKRSRKKHGSFLMTNRDSYAKIPSKNRNECTKMSYKSLGKRGHLVTSKFNDIMKNIDTTR